MSPYENAHSRSGHGYREMNLNNKFQHYYRPQTKFAKVMFLHVSVILSRGWYPSMPCSSPGPHPAGGEVEGSGWGSPGPHPGGRLRGLARGVSRPTPRGSPGPHPGGPPGQHPGGSPGPHPGGCIPACTESDPPPDGYCCGRYASYWNAFLFEIDKGLLTCFPGFLLWITPYQQ